MKLRIAGAFALAAASSLYAQVAPVAAAVPSVDPSVAAPSEGNWIYAAATDGSEANFVNAAGQPQLTIHCSRAVRQVIVSKPSSSIAPFMWVWTSGPTRNLPASFNPTIGRVTATVAAYDPLLDAIAFSRGRVGFQLTGQPMLIVPAWQEATRVIEDCRV
jgi:hypothetical protein